MADRAIDAMGAFFDNDNNGGGGGGMGNFFPNNNTQSANPANNNTGFLGGFMSSPFNMLSNMFNSQTVDIKSNLRHTVLYPGNVVEGFVEVTVKSPTPFTAVRVKLAAKEYVYVEKHTQIRHPPPPGSPPNTPYRTETRIDRRNSKQGIYKSLVTLAGMMKTVPMAPPSVMLTPGTFTYPFSFQLPPHMPPSFSRKVNDDFAELLYCVKTYVEGPGGRLSVHRNFITVIRPMPISQYQMAAPYQQPKSFNLECCCCCSKGSVALMMVMNRTLIALDRDEVDVFCDIDNTNGEEPVEKMHLRLTADVAYRAAEISQRGSIVVGTGTFDQRVEAGQKGRMSGKIVMKRDALPSIKTQNVNISYNMTASLEIPWADDPVFPINVMVAQSVDMSNYAQPMQWNEPAFVPLPKGRHSVPETYYQPPQQPVYQVQMFQAMPAPPPNVPMVQYQYNLPPYGLPPPTWQQQAPPTVHGQVYQSAQPQQQIQWQQGLSQTAV